MTGNIIEKHDPMVMMLPLAIIARMMKKWRPKIMRKESIKLSIDKEVLDIARQEIPNISRFTEECLRKYLGIGTTLTPLYKQQELLETIGKCHLELHLMNELEHVEEMKRKMELEKINYAWRLVFTHYRDTGKINEKRLQYAYESIEH